MVQTASDQSDESGSGGGHDDFDVSAVKEAKSFSTTWVVIGGGIAVALFFLGIVGGPAGTGDEIAEEAQAEESMEGAGAAMDAMAAEEGADAAVDATETEGDAMAAEDGADAAVEGSSGPFQMSEPVVALRPAGQLSDFWLSGNLIGSDNEAAAIRPVYISGSPNRYKIRITNQFNFTCDLGVNGNGDPGALRNCSSPEDVQIDRDIIFLTCATNNGERLCEGDFALILGDDISSFGYMKIAKIL